MRPRSGGDAWRFSAGAGRARRPRVCPASSDAWPAPCRHAWGLDGDVPASQTSSFASRGSVSETSSDLPSHKKSSRARTPHALAAVSSACRSSGVGGGSASIASWRLGPPRPRPGPTAPPSGLSGLSLSASDSGGLRSAESRSPKRSTTPRQERPNGPVCVMEGAGGRWNEAPVADLRARGSDLSGSGGSVQSEGPPPWEVEVARRPRGGTRLRGGRSRARGGLRAPGGPGTVLPGAARGPGAAHPWAPSRDLHGRRTPALGTSTSRCKWRQQEAKEGSVPERLPCDAVVVTKSDCDTFLVSSAGCARIPLSDRPATPSAEGHTCWGARGQGPLPAAWGNSPPGPARSGGGAGPPTRPLPTPPCPPCPGG